MESENKHQILALSTVTYGTFITMQLCYGLLAGYKNNFDCRKICLSEIFLSENVVSENSFVGKFAVGKIVSENLPSEKLCRKICRRKNIYIYIFRLMFINKFVCLYLPWPNNHSSVFVEWKIKKHTQELFIYTLHFVMILSTPFLTIIQPNFYRYSARFLQLPSPFYLPLYTVFLSFFHSCF